ncbi:hypothetical protein ACHAWX_002644 [Stephanocyclus meneghinianus]
MSDDKVAPTIPSSPAADEAQAPPKDSPNTSIQVDDVDGAATALASVSVDEAATNNGEPSNDEAQQPAVAVQDQVENAPENAAHDEAQVPAPNAEFLSLLPPVVHPRLAHLKSLHAQRDELLQRYQVERAALELKYADLMKPLYEERRKVVAGELDGVIQEKATQEGADAGNEAGGGEEVKGVPQFWACAMGNMDVVAELITEEDIDCLEYLTDIACKDFPDGTGFELAFHFSPNPYFANPILTKRYEVPNLLTEDEPILKNVTGTVINWKPNKSLTFKKVTKKQRKKGGRGAGQIRTISKEERVESFFHFFSPPKMPAMAEIMDEEEADAVEEAFDRDYDVAQAFRGCIVPKAILWFTGEAMEEDYDEGMEGFIADEDEDGGDHDDDDDDDDGDENGEGAEGQTGEFQFKFNSGTDNKASSDGENPECKQS